MGLCACGTLAPDGGGASDLPVSGAGPYRRSATGGGALLLADAHASLDDAQVFPDGDGLVVYFTRAPGDGTSEIRRARIPIFGKPPSAPEKVLAADQAWEGGAVAQPALLPPARAGEPWLLFYAAGGAIGYATSADGTAFHKAAGPALTAAAEEGAALASPAALSIAGADAATDRARLLYLGAGNVFAADARWSDLAAGVARLERIDGDPSTPARDPLLRPGAAPWLAEISRFTARTVHTAADRDRFDLFVGGRTADARVVGFAASFDATRFAVAAAPFIDPKPPDKWAPTVSALGAGSVLLFTRCKIAPPMGSCAAATVIDTGISP